MISTANLMHLKLNGTDEFKAIPEMRTNSPFSNMMLTLTPLHRPSV